MSGSPQHPHLPYVDAKPQGAADFYFAINATFRFVLDKLGTDGLREYWSSLGRSYYRPVSEAWCEGGLTAVADYWRDFFTAEPEADVTVHQKSDAVILEVRQCPAISHLKRHNRNIVACYCEHCYFVSDAIAAPAGYKVRIEGGNGVCRQSFSVRQIDDLPQDLNAIKRASSL